MDAVESFYVNGLPLHVSDRASSVINISAYEDHQDRNPSDTMTLLRRQHLLTLGHDVGEGKFEKDTLRKLRRLDARVDVEGRRV